MTTYKYTEGYFSSGASDPSQGSWKMAGSVATVTSYNINEPDTYTLIPNGKEYSKRANAKGEYIDAYIVQHDQTGSTIPYLGSSSEWYKFFTKIGVWRYGNKSVFCTFAMWSKSYRNKWKETQAALIKEEGQKPMNLTATEISLRFAEKPQPPANPYFEYVDKGWRKLETLREELYDYEDLINNFDHDNFDPEWDMSLEDLRKERALLSEAYYYAYKKGNNNMYATSNTAIVATAQPEAVAQREYLLARLDKIFSTKRKELHSHFKLDPTAAPKTLRELVEKLKSGDFSIDDKFMDLEQYYGATELIHHVRWTKDKADQAGYDAAIKKMEAAKTETTDIIKILSPEEGLKALQKFEDQTFH